MSMTFIHSFQTLSFPDTDLEAGDVHRTLHVLKELIKTLLLVTTATDMGWVYQALCQVLYLYDPTYPSEQPSEVATIIISFDR